MYVLRKLHNKIGQKRAKIIALHAQKKARKYFRENYANFVQKIWSLCGNPTLDVLFHDYKT